MYLLSSAKGASVIYLYAMSDYVTAAQMAEVDRRMIEEFGVDLLQMMEMAGNSLFEVAVVEFDPDKATVLVGKGNNGGGGLVAARYLHNIGVDVEILLGCSEMSLRNAPKRHLATARKLGIPVVDRIDPESDVILDCLLGYNAKGAPEGEVETLIKMALRTDIPILALDIPTGFRVDVGGFHEVSMGDVPTLTIARPKVGMDKLSHVWVADIGIPPEAWL